MTLAQNGGRKHHVTEQRKFFVFSFDKFMSQVGGSMAANKETAQKILTANSSC